MLRKFAAIVLGAVAAAQLVGRGVRNGGDLDWKKDVFLRDGRSRSAGFRVR
jgi:hypothetical protein